jgi:hypothetical protein
MPVNVKYESFGINGTERPVGPINEYVFRQLQKLWRTSIRSFFREASKHILIDSGMSRASLLPLATHAQARTALIAEFGGGGARPGHTTARAPFSNNNAPFRSRALGERLGREALGDGRHVLEFGTPELPQLVFRFEIVVLQHFLHENGLGKGSPQAQHSLQKGMDAFLETFSRNFDEMINPEVISTWLITGRVPNG